MHAHLRFHQKVSVNCPNAGPVWRWVPFAPPLSYASFNCFTCYCCKSKQRQNSLHIHKWESERVASGPAEIAYNSLIKLETKRERGKEWVSEWRERGRRTQFHSTLFRLFKFGKEERLQENELQNTFPVRVPELLLPCSGAVFLFYFYLRVGALT